jgi:hypothetical protein
MAGSDLPSYTLTQGLVVSFIAGIFLGLYFISLAFANRWLLFTNDRWMFKPTIHYFTLIITNAIRVLVVVNQVMKVDMSLAKAEFVEQGHPTEEYVELHWRSILQVSR